MITKDPINDKAFTKNIVLTKSARDAWKLIINSVKREEKQVSILLPSYIGFTEREGSGIFDPVEYTKSKYSFYGLNNNLGVDYSSLEKLVKDEKFDILLIVHYFGFCRNDLNKIKNLCEENNIILVEDCAHAFHWGMTPESLGILGDFSFYSVHKYLPVNSGGILKNISRKIELIDLPSEERISHEVALSIIKSDYKDIARKRILNFNLYKKKLAGVEGIEIMYDLENGEIPHSFPVRIKNKKREPLYFYLMDKDMPTIALYYRLIDELTADAYPESFKLSEEILNLPLHQDTTEEDIEVLSQNIIAFLSTNDQKNAQAKG